MYIDKLLPFVKESDFVRNTVETHRIEDIFIPFDKVNSDSVQTKKGRMFNAFYIKPCDILVMNESDETSNNILNGVAFYTAFDLNAFKQGSQYTFLEKLRKRIEQKGI
jgi:hypothetical protein